MTESTAQRVFAIFNICEGMLWLAIAAGVLIVLWRKRQEAGLMLALAALFATFGLSDWVEIRTGGWYKPWWMLMWKASNLVGLAIVLLLLRQRDRKAFKAQAEESGRESHSR